MKEVFFIVFISAFLLNFIWEEFHSNLYVEYKGRPITHGILAYASSFDAFVTVLSLVFFLYTPLFEGRLWLVLLGDLIFAVGLEIFALRTNRWKYKPSMPLIPFLRVGVTPTIQLALIVYVSFLVAGVI